MDTLAYRYTRQAPKTIKPADNVIIRLCSIECCFSHPLAERISIAGDSFRVSCFFIFIGGEISQKKLTFPKKHGIIYKVIPCEFLPERKPYHEKNNSS